MDRIESTLSEGSAAPPVIPTCRRPGPLLHLLGAPDGLAETPKVRATADLDCPLRRSSRLAAVWSGAEDPVLHPVAGLRSTRRLKRPAHPNGHRCGVPQFAGVLSVQGPDALHNGGRLGAAPHTLVDENAGEDVAQGLAAHDRALPVLANRSRPCPAFFFTRRSSRKRAFT